MTDQSSARTRPTGRRGRAGAWCWLGGVVVMLLVVAGLGTGPLALAGIAEGVTSDTALIGGLLTGVGFGLLWLRRDREQIDDALRDPDTGLFTRDYATETATRLIARDRRVGQPRLALVMLSLDDADDVARRYGEPAVMLLLARIADTLRSQCRTADLPFRHAPYVLGVYLHCDGIEQADAFGRRIQILLGSQQLDWRGDVLKPVVGLAMATCVAGDDLSDLHRRAESERATGAAQV